MCKHVTWLIQPQRSIDGGNADCSVNITRMIGIDKRDSTLDWSTLYARSKLALTWTKWIATLLTTKKTATMQSRTWWRICSLRSLGKWTSSRREGHDKLKTESLRYKPFTTIPFTHFSGDKFARQLLKTLRQWGCFYNSNAMAPWV